MKRTDFLQLSTGLIALALPDWSIGATTSVSEKRKSPRYLVPGDKIGICSPAGPVSLQDIQPAVDQLVAWGFIPVVGQTPGKKYFNLGGTDQERLTDLQTMLDAPDLQAILFARGGYGVVRILDQINWKRFQQHPKWVVGFSDITLLHAAIAKYTQIPTIHAKMATSFPRDPKQATTEQTASIQSIYDALVGKPIALSFPHHPDNVDGLVTGKVYGGNLRNIESLLGTPHQLPDRHSILLLEDTGEYPYSIDRMFWHLQQCGVFHRIDGLILGGFRMKPDDPGEEFGLSLGMMIREKLGGRRIPVAFQAPVGHQPMHLAIKLGLRYQLKVSAQEPSVLNQV